MEGGCCFQRCLQCEELKEQVGVQRLIVIRPVDGQVPTNGNVCIDKVVQPVVDQVQGCDCKVRADAVDAAVQPSITLPTRSLLFSLTIYSSLLSNLTMSVTHSFIQNKCYTTPSLPSFRSLKITLNWVLNLSPSHKLSSPNKKVSPILITMCTST